MPRWLLLATVFYAPWAYGCMRPWTIELLNWFLAAILVLWPLRCWVRGSAPRVPWLLIAVCLALAIQGWWMVLNARDTRSFFGPHLLAWAPGSVDRSASIATATRVTLLLGITCFVCDLGHRPRWRKRLWSTMALAGGSICLFGLLQRAAGSAWMNRGVGLSDPNAFATFNYYANASAFINLVWPVAAGLLVAAVQKQRAKAERILWAGVLAISLGAGLVTTSRAGTFVLLALALLLLVVIGSRRFRPNWLEVDRRILLATILPVFLLAASLAVATGLERTCERWGKFPRELSSHNSRLLAAQVCVRMLPEAGWWGFGPGTFPEVFYDYVGAGSEVLRWRWDYAHEDYLQTLIEWGRIGALFWLMLFLGAVFHAVRRVTANAGEWSLRDRTVLGASLGALLGVALHAFVDYPLQVASIQFYVALLLGLFWSCEGLGRPRSGERAVSDAGLEDASGKH